MFELSYDVPDGDWTVAYESPKGGLDIAVLINYTAGSADYNGTLRLDYTTYEGCPALPELGAATGAEASVPAFPDAGENARPPTLPVLIADANIFGTSGACAAGERRVMLLLATQPEDLCATVRPLEDEGDYGAWTNVTHYSRGDGLTGPPTSTGCWPDHDASACEVDGAPGDCCAAAGSGGCAAGYDVGVQFAECYRSQGKGDGDGDTKDGRRRLDDADTSGLSTCCYPAYDDLPNAAEPLDPDYDDLEEPQEIDAPDYWYIESCDDDPALRSVTIAVYVPPPDNSCEDYEGEDEYALVSVDYRRCAPGGDYLDDSQCTSIYYSFVQTILPGLTHATVCLPDPAVYDCKGALQGTSHDVWDVLQYTQWGSECSDYDPQDLGHVVLKLTSFYGPEFGAAKIGVVDDASACPIGDAEGAFATPVDDDRVLSKSDLQYAQAADIDDDYDIWMFALDLNVTADPTCADPGLVVRPDPLEEGWDINDYQAAFLALGALDAGAVRAAVGRYTPEKDVEFATDYPTTDGVITTSTGEVLSLTHLCLAENATFSLDLLYNAGDDDDAASDGVHAWLLDEDTLCAVDRPKSLQIGDDNNNYAHVNHLDAHGAIISSGASSANNVSYPDFYSELTFQNLSLIHI